MARLTIGLFALLLLLVAVLPIFGLNLVVFMNPRLETLRGRLYNPLSFRKSFSSLCVHSLLCPQLPASQTTAVLSLTTTGFFPIRA